MTDNSNIENLFKDAFDKFEAPVDASVWNGVEQGLKNIPSAPVPASVVVKSFSALKAVIAVVSVATIAVVTWSVLKTKSPEAINTPLPTTETVIEKSNLNSENTVANTSSEKISVANKNVAAQKATEIKKTVENNLAVGSGTNAAQDVAQQSAPDNSGSTPASPTQTNIQKQPATITTPDNTQKQTTEPVKENESEATQPAESTASPITANCDLNLSNNTFTPNGDNINDVYYFSDDNFKEIHVKILDLRGKIIKQWDKPGGVWDGKLPNGNNAETGRYALIINAVCTNGATVNKKATINLLRP